MEAIEVSKTAGTPTADQLIFMESFSQADEMSLDTSYQFFRVDVVAGLAGVSAPSIRRWVREGSFPIPEEIGPQAKGWRRSEYEFWAKSPKTWAIRNLLRELEELLNGSELGEKLAKTPKTPMHLADFVIALNREGHKEKARELRNILSRL